MRSPSGCDRGLSDTVKVGRELAAGKSCELGQGQGERLGHGAADLDHKMDRDRGGGSGEVPAEAWESVDRGVGRGEALLRGS